MDWISSDSNNLERFDSKDGFVYLPCSELPWQPIDILQVSFDPRLEKDPFHLRNLKALSIAYRQATESGGEESFCNDLQFYHL